MGIVCNMCISRGGWEHAHEPNALVYRASFVTNIPYNLKYDKQMAMSCYTPPKKVISYTVHITQDLGKCLCWWKKKEKRRPTQKEYVVWITPNKSFYRAYPMKAVIAYSPFKNHLRLKRHRKLSEYNQSPQRRLEKLQFNAAAILKCHFQS